jgi:SAM-dependent methyltransferase
VSGLLHSYLDDYEHGYDTTNQYWTDNKLSMEWYPQRIIDISASTGEEAVLDLGLGHGKTTEYFENFFKDYEVIEGSLLFIDKFQRDHPNSNITFINCYFEDFPGNKKWDLIIMGYILEHVEDPNVILRKYRELLKPGGTIFIVVPNAESLHRRFGHEAGLLDDMDTLSADDLGFGHKRYFTVKSLSDLVESNNYKINRIEGIFLKPITSQQMKDLQLSSEILQGMLKVGIHYPELSNSILMEIMKK